MKLPSKELLNEVLEYPKEVVANVEYIINIIDEPYFLDNYTSTIWFNTDNVGLGVCKINIHEFSNKCKEWAESVGPHGFSLSSGTTDEYSMTGCEETRWMCEIAYSPNEVFYGKTEPEAIFKACEWIMNDEANKKEMK